MFHDPFPYVCMYPYFHMYVCICMYVLHVSICITQQPRPVPRDHEFKISWNFEADKGKILRCEYLMILLWLAPYPSKSALSDTTMLWLTL